MSGIIVSRKDTEKKRSFFTRFLKHLSRELGIPFTTMVALVGIYNKFLYYMIGSTGSYVVKRTSKAVGQVVKASSNAMITLMSEITDYIIDHPGEIATCSASIYLAKDSKGFTSELSTFAKRLGKAEFQRIGITANQIAQQIMDDFVSKNVQNKLLSLPGILPENLLSLPGILPENLQSLLLPTPESLIPDTSSLQILGLNETVTLPDMVLPPNDDSSAKALLQSMSCSVYGKFAKYGIDIFRGCDNYLLTTQGFSTIQTQCPRINNDIQTLVERVGEDLNYAVGNAMTRASTDISREVFRTKSDLLFSANTFVFFLAILFLFLYIWRNVVLRLCRVSRRAFGMTRKSVRKPRKSVRKPRKSVRKPRKSVRKSTRKPRKSARKSARKSVRKSTRKPRKSVRKSVRKPRKSSK